MGGPNNGGNVSSFGFSILYCSSLTFDKKHSHRNKYANTRLNPCTAALKVGDARRPNGSPRSLSQRRSCPYSSQEISVSIRRSENSNVGQQKGCPRPSRVAEANLSCNPHLPVSIGRSPHSPSR